MKRKVEILHKKVIFKAFFNIKQTHSHIYMKDGVIFASWNMENKDVFNAQTHAQKTENAIFLS